MPYVIQTVDNPERSHLRVEVRDEHVAWLKDNVSRLLAGGALLADDGGQGSGGLIILDTEDRAEAEAFIAEDPFTKAGLFQDVMITRWRKGFFNGETLI
jgi:uncharacterized protein